MVALKDVGAAVLGMALFHTFAAGSPAHLVPRRLVEDPFAPASSSAIPTFSTISSPDPVTTADAASGPSTIDDANADNSEAADLNDLSSTETSSSDTTFDRTTSSDSPSAPTALPLQLSISPITTSIPNASDPTLPVAISNVTVIMNSTALPGGTFTNATTEGGLPTVIGTNLSNIASVDTTTLLSDETFALLKLSTLNNFNSTTVLLPDGSLRANTTGWQTMITESSILSPNKNLTNQKAMTDTVAKNESLVIAANGTIQSDTISLGPDLIVISKKPVIPVNGVVPLPCACNCTYISFKCCDLPTAKDLAISPTVLNGVRPQAPQQYIYESPDNNLGPVALPNGTACCDPGSGDWACGYRADASGTCAAGSGSCLSTDGSLPSPINSIGATSP